MGVSSCWSKIARKETIVTNAKMPNAKTASFWNFDEAMLERLVEEPEGAANGQLLPMQKYYKHGVSACEIDYMRAMLSMPLRGLQGKTQVFPMDREHFVRSRLTHTLEVAVNAAEIFDEMLAKADDPDPDCGQTVLTEKQIQTLRYALMTACLLHDAGNPPFGHFGEEAIRDWFNQRDAASGEAFGDLDLCYFEGNANSLRMALRGTGLYDGRRLNPTLLTLCAMVKYPWDAREAVARKPKKVKYNYFASDSKRVEELQRASKKAVGLSDRERSKLSLVMEAADDVSYATGDFEDAFRKGMFTVDEAVSFMAKRWLSWSDEGRFSKKCRQNTLTLIYLLSFIAGDEEDYEWMNNFISGVQEDDNLIAKSGRIGPHYADYLLANGGGYPRGSDTVHTFRKALADGPNGKLDAAQRRQMQETYVGRWVDVVRAWLRYSVACSLSRPDVDGEKEADLFGDHYATIMLLKDVLEHFVYTSPENAKLNARAETVLKGLLDKFVPAAEECIQENEAKSGKSPINPEGISSTAASLIALIPMRYRLDYESALNASEPRWDADRQRYELDMMVLDFVSSLPDDYAVQLYNDLYEAK